MGIQADDIQDLLVASQKDLGRGKFTDLSTDLQKYVAMKTLMAQKRMTFDEGGTAIQWNLMTDDNGQATNTSLYSRHDYNFTDTMITASVPWRHTRTNYMIEDREITMNRKGKNWVLNQMKLRRHAALVSLAKLLETNWWGKPDDSTDTETPYGVDYWIVRNASQGFNGGIPSGFSDVAGVSPTTYERWKNYTDQYVSLTEDDAVSRMRRAYLYCDFESPVAHESYSGSGGYGIYMGYDERLALEKLAETRNDNLGNDLASKDGKVTFRGIALTGVPKLNADTQDPIYGINWSDFDVCFLPDEYMREEEPRKLDDRPRTRVVDLYLSYQFRCTNRRTQFILNIA